MAVAYVSVRNIHHLYLPGRFTGDKAAGNIHGITFRTNPFKELPCGVPKALKTERCGCYSRGVNESSNLNTSIRAVSVSSATKYYDFAVIGSGVAGLRYALEVAKQGTVAVITKYEPQESNTNYAQGGVSAVLYPLDSIESHMQMINPRIMLHQQLELVRSLNRKVDPNPKRKQVSVSTSKTTHSIGAAKEKLSIHSEDPVSLDASSAYSKDVSTSETIASDSGPINQSTIGTISKL